MMPGDPPQLPAPETHSKPVEIPLEDGTILSSIPMPEESLAPIAELFRNRFLRVLRDENHLSAHKATDPR